MALHPPVCPECGGASRPTELPTKPAVFMCDECSEMFTRRSRGVPVPTLRRIRRQIVQRWDQLADDVFHLIREIREAPEGTFTDQERHEATFELDNTVWDVMVNHRPRLPGGARQRASQEMQGLLRRERLIREFIDSGDYERVKQEAAQDDAKREGGES